MLYLIVQVFENIKLTNIEKGLNEVLKSASYWEKSPLWTKSKIKKATKNWFKYLK